MPLEKRVDNTTSAKAAKGFNEAYSKWDRFVDIRCGWVGCGSGSSVLFVVTTKRISTQTSTTIS